MTSGELLKYVKGVFDTEICLYVQQESLAEMKRIYNNLDTGRKVFAPHKKQNDESVLSNMHIVSLIFAAIVGFLIAIIMFVDIYKDAKTVIGGIIGGFFMAIFSFFVAAVFGWAIGLAIGFVVGIVRKIVEQKRINKQFEYDLIQYRQDLSDDDLRLVIEKKKKLALGKDIAEMENQIWTTRQNLQKMYSYDIIKPAYRNIVAVGTFYTYLATERTYSLTFDRNTGDQGAYNLYEQERRMDILITNTERILDRLDDIAMSQQELANGLINANRQISAFRNDFSRFANQTINNMEEIRRIESVNEYNISCIRRQTELMNWLTIVRY